MSKHIVYLTTNLKSKINGINRIYIGVHKTENPDIFDGYIGCGVKINVPSSYRNPETPFQYAVKKYGTEAFKRSTLYVYDTAKEAYNKERELVDAKFIAQDYTYNVVLGGEFEDHYRPLYQFTLDGTLIKCWERSSEAYEFYGVPKERFDSPKRNKCIFLNSYWSISPKIDVTEYSKTPITKITYLYSRGGKLLKEFDSQTKCAEYINYDKGELTRAIKEQRLIKKQYYVSNSLTDEFKPSPRKNYMNIHFFVYTVNNEYLGEYVGKELMDVIKLKSWADVDHIFTHNKNWYKDFYISLEKIEKVPTKRIGNGICVDVYTNFGEFIETCKSIKEVKEKYNIPASKIKNIQYGDKYYNNYIFKYNNK